eukprot:scaffold152_cov52-Cyclotella_meneghiniana.AAC.2
MAEPYYDDDDLPDPSLKNIIEQESLQWIFVGGKGGVGKTTTSCCLGTQLAKYHPAHNLSDAFCQKIGREPTPIQGFTNLSAMEIDASEDIDKMQRSFEDSTGGNDDENGIQSLMTELTNSIPGIDEAMSFSELMKQVQTLDYDVVVFDTAPTGHTLRLLSFPTILEKAFGKLMDLKDRFGGLIGQASALFGGGSPDQVQAALLGRLEETRAIINKVNTAFQDPALTTFDAEELGDWYEGNKYQLPKEAREICSKMMARKRMQDKYIGQCFDLYGDDFHVVLMPLLDHEIKAVSPRTGVVCWVGRPTPLHGGNGSLWPATRRDDTHPCCPPKFQPPCKGMGKTHQLSLYSMRHFYIDCSTTPWETYPV